MIAFTSAAQMRRDLDLVPEEITFGEAAGRLLTLMHEGRVLINAGWDSITVATAHTSSQLGGEWIVNYKYPECVDSDDFKRFYRLSRLAAYFMFYREGLEEDGSKMAGACTNFAHGRPIPEPGEIAADDINAMIIYLAGWLLGRKIELQIQTDDDMAALLLGLQEELDNAQTRLEDTFALCLS